MGLPSKTNLTRLKLKKIELPKPALICLFCRKPLSQNANAVCHTIAGCGIVYFACLEHLKSAEQLFHYTKDYIDGMIKAALEEESKIE